MEDSKRMKLYTDGGARGNPGPAACACLLFDKKDNLIAFDAKFIGEGTNNTAEYQGILLGLKLAKKYSPSELHCYLDSELIVKQINGEYKVKHPVMQQLKEKVDKSMKNFDNISFVHIPRKQNAHADQLLNLILDTVLG